MQETNACISVGKLDQDIDSVYQQIQLPEFCALDYFMNLFHVESHLSSFSPSLDRKPNSVLLPGSFLACHWYFVGCFHISFQAVSLIGRT